MTASGMKGGPLRVAAHEINIAQIFRTQAESSCFNLFPDDRGFAREVDMRRSRRTYKELQ